MEHPLRAVLFDAARGRAPEPDGSIDVLPAPEGARAAIVLFPGHLVVAAPIDGKQVDEWVAPGDFASWIAPEFVGWLAATLDARVGSQDVVLVAPGERRPPAIALRHAGAAFDHPRVRQASRARTDVNVWVDDHERGVLVVGCGLTGRYELAFEVSPDWRGHGLGRAIAATARTLVPEGEPLFAQVAAANAPSLRALLAAGFAPIGAEILFFPH